MSADRQTGPADPVASSRPTMSLAGIRCLVLGGGGFLGLNLCNRLAEAGAEGVGRSTAKAVVITSITILVLDGLIAAMFATLIQA